MSAVMKENPVSDADENTDMAVIEPKSLADLLKISEACPADFYKNPTYLNNVKNAKLIAGSLVHTIDEQGRADSKKDAAAIRKFVTTTNGFTLIIFRSLTEKVTKWREEFTVETKDLSAIANGIDAKFKKMEQEKLDSIYDLLSAALTSARDELLVKPGFRHAADLKPMIKLSGTLTDKGKLTAKATAFIKAIADGELAKQNKFEGRILILENRCLRADIDPPLTHVHLGTVMFAEDDVFNAKVEELVAAEIERRTEMAARIERKNAAENQKKIDDALKSQREEDERKAQEKAQQEAATAKEADAAIGRALHFQSPTEYTPSGRKVTPDSLRKTADSIAQSAQYADRSDDKAKDLAEASKLRQQATELEQQQDQPLPETRTVIITATFEFSGISNKTSNDGVERFFRNKLPEQMQVKILTLSSQNA